MIEIIKEYVKQTHGQFHCILRSRTYTSSLDYFLMLFKEATKDFKDLRESQVEVIQYGGRHYKGTFGIEFKSTEKPPKEYEKRKAVEFKL